MSELILKREGVKHLSRAWKRLCEISINLFSCDTCNQCVDGNTSIVRPTHSGLHEPAERHKPELFSTLSVLLKFRPLQTSSFSLCTLGAGDAVPEIPSLPRLEFKETWHLCEVWNWQQLLQPWYELPHQHLKRCIVLWAKVYREDFLQMGERGRDRQTD